MKTGNMILGNTEIKPGEQTTVDFFVSRLPSGNRINIQATVYRALKPGPTVLVMGGVHGDEINGIQIIRTLLEDDVFSNITCGTVIAIPLLNVFGFINFSREVPDGKDVNRSFPGTSTGSLVSRTASVLTKKVLPHIDYAIDLHTGGASRYNQPQIRYTKTDEKAVALAKAFGAPFIIEKPWITKSFRKIANQMGISVIVYEGGESVRLDSFAIKMGIDGIKRTLKALKMLKEAPKKEFKPIGFTTTSWVRASESGLFTWQKRSGEIVKKGDLLGVIHSPQGDRAKYVIAKKSGHIIGHNNASVVHNGDALFHIGFR